MTKQTKLEREGFDACYIAQNTDEVQLHLSFRAGDEIRVIQEGDTIVVYSRSTPPKTKPSIDWSHLKPDIKWIARDMNGKGYAYANKPSQKTHEWSSLGTVHNLEIFASYEAGDCDWKDSLVMRGDDD